MSDPFLPEIHARIRQAFLLGLARVPLSPPRELAGLLSPGRESELALLALAGQRQRFIEPPPVAIDELPDAAKAMHADPRPVMPPAARRAFLRLLSSVEKALAASVIPLVTERIMASGHRLHPFDLPELGRHVRTRADRLGVAERAYLALTAREADDDDAKGLFFQRITLDNWTTFPKGQRREFLLEQRRADPAAARLLLESAWSAEPAPVRLVLLEALAVNLGQDDAPFLEKLAKDRADSVKKAAAALLGRMPSSVAYDCRLATAAACFVRPSGLSKFVRELGIGSDQQLTFVVPPAEGDATNNWAAQDAWRERIFASLALDDLTAAVQATPEEIVGALPPGDVALLRLFIETAWSTGNAALVSRILAARLLMEAALPSHLLLPLADASRVVLPPDLAGRCLSAPLWQATIAELSATAQSKDDGRLVIMATLLPREAGPEFLASIDGLSIAVTRAARDCTDLISALPDHGASS